MKKLDIFALVFLFLTIVGIVIAHFVFDIPFSLKFHEPEPIEVKIDVENIHYEERIRELEKKHEYDNYPESYCETDGALYLSNPGQYKCKDTGEFIPLTPPKTNT